MGCKWVAKGGMQSGETTGRWRMWCLRGARLLERGGVGASGCVVGARCSRGAAAWHGGVVHDGRGVARGREWMNCAAATSGFMSAMALLLHGVP